MKISDNVLLNTYGTKNNSVKHLKQKKSGKLFGPTGQKSVLTAEKTLAGVGMLALGIGALLFGKIKSAGTSIQKVQKVFKDVFMRDDISEKSAIEIIKRYKEIEKIPDKKEYVQALFKEAKKNYGFTNGTLHCKFINDPTSTGGMCYASRDYIEINLAHDREKMLEYVHHELRHAKQHYCAFNYDPEAAVRAAMENDYTSVLNGTSVTSEFMRPIYLKYKNFEEFYQAMQPVKENILNTVKNKYGLKEFSKDLISESQYEYAQKCIAGMKTKVDPSVDYKGYYTNFLEGGDAYPAGINIAKALRKAYKDIP